MRVGWKGVSALSVLVSTYLHYTMHIPKSFKKLLLPALFPPSANWADPQVRSSAGCSSFAANCKEQSNNNHSRCPSECTVTGGMYRLQPEECERGSAEKAKESPDNDHLGTQKEPSNWRGTKRHEDSLIPPLTRPGMLRRAPFLDSIEG